MGGVCICLCCCHEVANQNAPFYSYYCTFAAHFCALQFLLNFVPLHAVLFLFVYHDANLSSYGSHVVYNLIFCGLM